EPIGIVVAAREPGVAFQHLSKLEVRGLRDGDARTLLASAALFKLDERVRERIVAETRGNPLALLELPRDLTKSELAGGFGSLAAQAVPRWIEDSFIRRLSTLPHDARRLSLVAAAEPLGDPFLLWDAAARLGIRPAAADAAVAAGLLTIAERVTFRHPLVRSAVYRSAAADDRRAVHRALAEATDRAIDPDRRTWHLAAATPGPAEEIAFELERSAARAQARGGLAAAAAFLRRAVAMSVDPIRRADRALAAAQSSFQAGAFDVALGLVATAEAEALDGFQQARADLLRGHIAFVSGLGTDAPPLLLKAARRLEPFDAKLARETYLTAWGAAVFAGAGMLADICRAARALPASPGTPRPLDLLLDGLASLTTDGRDTATPMLQRAANALADMPVEDVLRLGWAARAASAQVWDFDGMLAISARQVQIVRDVGALAQLPIHLSQLGLVRAWMGDFAGATSLAAEIDAVSAVTGSPIAPYTALLLRALQGRESEASATIASAIDRAVADGQWMAAAYARWAGAVLNNGLARYDAAAKAAQQGLDTRNPFISMWGLPELVEAAARCGDVELARDAVEQLAEATGPSATDWGLGVEARSRALLNTSAAADDLYREAIERLGRTRLRTELARAHLLYGEWLRRDGRRGDARGQLRVAHDHFTSMGMEGFAERARKELLATGEQPLKRTTPEKPDELTPQERQIARLASDGLSNTEIGAQLFLSPRTVEWHLHNVFVKLGIRSRRGLVNALPSAELELRR
ncbi:MAG TPA: LuxR C-terminal-related transcriptional regulator, partial [Candidatus Dormibacteraeota bacterium]|nr:LuxR C-terminal-related transcriptional regulator [Candidatus Dormibacteraeota bacterium]